MKHLLFIILFCLSFLNESYSWDIEAAKFYPLAVGNQWSYHYISRGGNPIPCYPNNQYDYIISITGDTVFNGHRYFKFSSGEKIRIDSTSMNVYRSYGTAECLIDSLLARKNSQVNSCELWGVVSDTDMVNFAGQNRRSFKISGIGYSKRLVHGIGVFYLGGCELGSGFDKQLNGCIINGVQYGVMLELNNLSSELPANFSLSQNYPNPFNPVTKIKFSIPQYETTHRDVSTRLIVFDVIGKQLAVLVNQQLQPGTYEVDWDASANPSGVYYYKLETGDPSTSLRATETKKMVLIK